VFSIFHLSRAYYFLFLLSFFFFLSKILFNFLSIVAFHSSKMEQQFKILLKSLIPRVLLVFILFYFIFFPFFFKKKIIIFKGFTTTRFDNHFAYSSSKAAVLHLTRVLAMQFASKRIFFFSSSSFQTFKLNKYN